MRVAASFLLLTLTAAAASAQTQIGVHYSALALEYPDQTRSGVGAFLVYAPRSWLGVEASATWAPDEVIGGRSWQVLAGTRVGGTIADLKVYGRIRPGFLHFSERFYLPDVVCVAIFPPPDSCLAAATNLALDLGTTIELDLSPQTVLRLDLGDTLVRYRGSSEDGSWQHGVQFTAGVGWRF